MADLLVAVALFAVSLAALLWASDVFVGAVERVGLALGVSPFILGATVVAGGTSLPELVSSSFAVVQGAPAIVVGNVVGSNVANICLVLGLSAVVARRISVHRELVRVDLPLLITSAVFLYVTAWDGTFAWYEGVIGLVGVVVYAHFTLSERGRLDEVVEEIVEEHAENPAAVLEPPTAEVVEPEATLDAWTVAKILGSLVVVLASADQLVTAILDVAGSLGVSTALVAITAVAVGTSLPEVAVSVMAVRRGDVEVSVGNILGSNIFNTFAVMGLPSFIGPLPIPEGVRTYALPAMVLTTLLYYFVTQNREITRWEGGAVLLLYAAFLVNLHHFV